MNFPSLRDLFWAHRGALSDKWEQYIPVYESEFRHHLERGAPVALLEIGVQNGGSLEIWQKFLPPHSRVVGMDIDERCRGLKLSEGIELHVGDATRKSSVNGALGETFFDIIIDDGSHVSNDVIASFEILFGRLKPGGNYIVEDMHCSYSSAYGGGFRAQGSSIEWAKCLVDAINADHFESISDLHGEEFARLRAFNREIARVAFFDSLLVVQKYLAPKHRPFARLLTGSEIPLFDPVDWIARMPTESLGNLMVAPSLAQRLEIAFTQRLEEKQRELKQQQQELKRQEQELKRQEQELKRREQELKGQDRELKRQGQQLKHQEQEIKSMLSSTSWKVTVPLRRAAEMLKSARRRFTGRFTGRH